MLVDGHWIPLPSVVPCPSSSWPLHLALAQLLLSDLVAYHWFLCFFFILCYLADYGNIPNVLPPLGLPSPRVLDDVGLGEPSSFGDSFPHWR